MKGRDYLTLVRICMSLCAVLFVVDAVTGRWGYAIFDAILTLLGMPIAAMVRKYLMADDQ